MRSSHGLRAPGQKRLDLGQFLSCQAPVPDFGDLFDLPGAARADDRGRDFRPAQHPGNRQIGQAATWFVRSPSSMARRATT